MSKPCGQMPSKPAKCMPMCPWTWQKVPLPLALQVYQGGGGGFRLVVAFAFSACRKVPPMAASAASAPVM
jgi:hypothetical protein